MPLQEYLRILAIVCPLVFLAGFIDAIAGGGGIISLPAYLLSGLPAHTAFGCNKCSSLIACTASTIKYGRTGNIRLKPALCAAVASLIGAWCGTQVVLRLSEETFKIMVMVVLPIVAVFLVTRKGFREGIAEEKDLTPTQQVVYPMVIGLLCGAYDGTVGPGTGTFLILAFSAFMGFNLVTSSGCAKVVNLGSNLGSAIGVIMAGKVLYSVAIPAAVASGLGSHLGSKTAIKGGAKFIRPTIFLVLAMLFVKIIYDFFLA